MIQRITLPRSLSLSNCLQFSREMFNTPEDDEYEFDFGNMIWAPPFSMVYLAAQINRFRRERPQALYRALNPDTNTYAAHMGFFEAFDLHYGNLVGQALGSDTYVPITEIRRNQLEAEASTVGDAIEENAGRLAEMLTRENQSQTFQTLRYSIREILRNSIEHSGEDSVLLCAQYWPTRERVEVGIVDCGIGIRQGLARNPHHEINTDEQALHLSMMPGVSGVAYQGAPTPHHDDVWANSGYGLFMTSRICMEAGAFFIASGNASTLIAGNDRNSYEQTFNGTAIRMLIDINRVQQLDNKLRQLHLEGQEIAAGITGTNTQGASPASVSVSVGSTDTS